MNNYAELVDKIINEGQKTNVVVSYTPSDLAYIEELKGELSKRSVLDHKRLFFFNGAHDGLVHFAHVMSGANLFAGPSTGTTHMANALKIGQVAIYSPIKVQSAKRWGPAYSWDQCFVLAPDNEKMAMKTITVDTVYLACQKVLNERSCNNE
jgi:heptosyltransferase-3